MQTKRYLLNILWIVIAWAMFLTMVSAPRDEFPFCASYEDC
jgi:hypothetical protein